MFSPKTLSTVKNPISPDKIQALKNKLEEKLSIKITQAMQTRLKKKIESSFSKHLIANNPFFLDLVRQFIDNIAYRQDILYKSKEQTIDVYAQFIVINCPQFISHVVQGLQYTDDAVILENLESIEISLDEAERCYAQMDALIQEVALASKPIDKRVYKDDGRALRRFDSLSRLVSLKPGWSICSAVTIVDGKLIIAANSSGHASTEEMASVLAKKVAIIRRFLQDTHDAFKRENTSQLDARMNEVIDNLIIEGGTTQGSQILKQALLKLVDATMAEVDEDHESCFNRFSVTERETLLSSSNVTILLPEGKRKLMESGVDNCIAMASVTPEGMIETMHRHALDTFTPKVLINHFHAEQLIVLYLKDYLHLDLTSADSPIRFGISKLCCETCYQVMQEHTRVQVRGTHCNSYEHTVNIFTKSVCPAPLDVASPPAPTTPRKVFPSPTEAEPSPYFSPQIAAHLISGKDNTDTSHHEDFRQYDELDESVRPNHKRARNIIPLFPFSIFPKTSSQTGASAISMLNESLLPFDEILTHAIVHKNEEHDLFKHLTSSPSTMFSYHDPMPSSDNIQEIAMTHGDFKMNG